jgi:CRP-like cAMP-binding protein
MRSEQNPPPSSAGTDHAALIRRTLHWTSLFSKWPERALDRVAGIARLERYERRTQALEQDGNQRELLVVVSGCLEVSRVNSGGTKFVLGLLGAGVVVGLVRLLDDLHMPYSYHAHEDTTLIHLPCDPLRGILDEDPVLWRDVALLALARQRDSIVSIQQRALAGRRQSIAHALVELSAWYGRSLGNTPEIRLRVSQNDLASMLGVSRQTMNKELRELAALGLIGGDYGQIVVRELAALRELAAAPVGGGARPKP